MNPEDMIDDADILDILEDAVEGEIEVEDEGFKALTEDQIESIASNAVQDAIDFIEAELTETRTKAQRYFDGEVDIGYEDGRSKIVASKVRDTIRSVKPSLMRVFLSSGRPVEYVPRGPEDVLMAEQATAYANFKFNELNGFRVLSDAFHDALLKKTGVVKVFYEERDTSEVHTFTGLNDMQYQAVITDPDIEVIEHSMEAGLTVTDGMEMPEPTTHDVKLIRRSSDGDICMVSVPPEDFFIDRNARSIDDCYVVGHGSEMRVGDLVDMGFDFDEVVDLGGRDSLNEEDDERRGYTVDPDEDENAVDPSMKNVWVTEAYMRIDADGTGSPTLHRVIMGGSNYKLLSAEPCDQIPFAIFEVDPEPHTFFGRSVADLLLDDQDAATSIMRGVLDNVAMTNTPRIGVIEGQVEMDDVLNNEVGGIIRMRQPGAVMPFAVPFTAGQTLGAAQYLDQMIETKTGVSRASMGLDPDSLQSTTRAAVTATVQAAAGQTEVMARNLAEGGMRSLFKLLLKLIVKHADAPKFMRLNGEFTPVDPRAWDTSMDLSVNVGLGTGREEERAAAYREVLGLQMQVYNQYGPGNGVVSLVNIRNTVSDMLASSGIRNSERYFQPITPEYEQQMAQEAAQEAQQSAQQGPQDPQAMAFMQAEQIKAQTKSQSDAMRIRLDGQKAIMDDDRKRDEMYQNMALKNAELQGKFGMQANEQAIRAEQERQRMMQGGA
jgi:hypothetical protein